jgi:hypothetical protein
MFSPKRLITVSLLIAALFACAGVVFGQGATGQITGTVEDSAGAVVPGAGVGAHAPAAVIGTSCSRSHAIR